MSKIKMAWGKDENGNLFAPKTLVEAIINKDGDSLEGIISEQTETIEDKVDKIEGKGLSTNDFTDDYKTKVDNSDAAKHTHSNKSILDTITQTLIDGWNSAVTHISDSVKHITKEERESWNGKADAATTLSGYGITDAATASQGSKADTAVQSVKIGTTEYKSGTSVVLPEYPTELPASDVKSWAKADNKPTYTASEVGALPNTTTHLSGDVPTSEKGANNGVATLGSDGKVPSSQLPSYVDDVLEYDGKSKFPTTGESGKIYIDTTTNITYRWGGSSYVAIGSDLALGETSSTAYAGNKGKANADAISALQTYVGNLEEEIPTRVSDLDNDSKFTTETRVSSYVEGEISTVNQKITNVDGKVSTLQKNTADELDKKVDKISGMGLSTNDFTNVEKQKLANAYEIPSSGVPKTDLSIDVQTSLGKADTALQSYTEKYTGTYSKPSSGIPKTDLASSVQTSLGLADTALQSHQDISGKVDKVSGKGLSTNDLTSALKSNYDTAYTHSQSAHAPSGAQANVIETVKVNGTALTPSSKAVNITVPTNNNQLTNGAGYITSSAITNKPDAVVTTSEATAKAARDGKVYYVNDGTTNIATAGQITYTTSSGTSSNVQTEIDSLNSKLDKKTQTLSGTISSNSVLTLNFTNITTEYPFYSINIDSCSDFSKLIMRGNTMKDGYLKVIVGSISTGSMNISATATGIKL